MPKVTYIAVDGQATTVEAQKAKEGQNGFTRCCPRDCFGLFGDDRI
jgi:hypothetical protein